MGEELIYAKKMTKNQLIEKVAKKANLTKRAAKDAVESMFGIIRENLVRGEKSVISGFGTFWVGKIATKRGRNPQTNQPLQIAEHKLAKFTAGKTLKRLIK